MNKLLKMMLCAAALQATVAMAAEPQPTTAPAAQQITRAGSQPSIMGPAQYFSGQPARIDPLWPANKSIHASGAYVTFEAGSRSNWHTHPAGQFLVVVSGVGLTQQWGKPVQVIRPGDVVWCPPGVKHWHGATPTTAVTILTVSGMVDRKNVIWMEPVTDEQYNAH